MASYYQPAPVPPHLASHAASASYFGSSPNSTPAAAAGGQTTTVAASATPAGGSYYAFQAQQNGPTPSTPQPTAAPHATHIPSIHQPHLQHQHQQMHQHQMASPHHQQYHSAPAMQPQPQPNYYQQHQQQMSSPPYGQPPTSVFLTPPHPPQPMYMSPPHHALGPPMHPTGHMSHQQFQSPPHMHVQAQMHQQHQQQLQQQHQQHQQQQQGSPQHISGVHTPQPLSHHVSLLSTSTSTPLLSAQKPIAPPPSAAKQSAPSAKKSPPPAKAAAPVAAVVPTLPTIFSDLDSRFLVNLPDEELSSFERIMFQLQQAHWFYLDWYSDRFPTLPKLSYKAFCTMFFKHIPSFRAHLSKFEQVYASFNQYLNAVPVCGCICLNPERTHCVMVRSYIGHAWGFPRGKLDANEDEITCAIRELEEEIGFDCRQWFKGYEITPAGALTRQTSSESTNSTTSSSSSALHASQPSFLEAQSSTKVIRLYVLQNVPNATKFETRTRKEIGEIGWIPLSALPSKGSNTNGGFAFTNMMQLFASKLRTFVKKLKAGEITGYGAYEQRQPGQTHNNQVQSPPQGANEPTSARKNKQAQQQQQSGKKNKATDGQAHAQAQAQAQAQPTQILQPPNRRESVKYAGQTDSRNAQTFASSSAPSSSSASSGGGGGGWSPEQMFAANAKLGVVSTVEEQKVQLPAHLDAQLGAALGRKAGAVTGGKQGRKEKKFGGASAHAPSDPIAIPNANLLQPSGHKAPQELDYGHNAYVNFANLNLHRQPMTSSPPMASAPIPAAAPAAVVVDIGTTPAGKKKEPKRRLPKGQQPATPPTQAAAPTIRIQKRPTADSVASSAPVASSVPSASEFKFDLDSILEPSS